MAAMLKQLCICSIIIISAILDGYAEAALLWQLYICNSAMAAMLWQLSFGGYAMAAMHWHLCIGSIIDIGNYAMAAALLWQ